MFQLPFDLMNFAIVAHFFQWVDALLTFKRIKMINNIENLETSYSQKSNLSIKKSELSLRMTR